MRASAIIALVVIGASAAQAQTVSVSWNRNTDSHTAGYRLYYGTASGNYQWSVDVGNQVSAPVNLSPGNIYYMVVRAYNASYQYGPPSAQSSVDLRTTTTPPTPPTSPTAPTARIQATLQSAGTAVVSWQTTNATRATINGVAVGVSGSQSVAIRATTTFTVVATSASGATARASATVTISPTTPTPTPRPPTSGAPTAPVQMTSTISGTRATLNWRPGAGGGVPTEYLLYVSTTSWGSNVVYGHNLGNILTVSGNLPVGRYYARVRARNRAGTSTSSNQVQFQVGRALATPTRFSVTWSGATATLRWTAVAADSLEDTPSGYVLDVGSSPGLNDIASAPLGNVTSFTADVTQGTYYVSVRAVNDLGGSAPTEELELVAPGAPQAPAALSGESTDLVYLRWAAPAGGPAPTGYVIEAGSEPGLSDLAKLQVATLTEFSTEAPPGTYFVRVRAVNEHGAGPASNEILIQR